MHQVLINEKYVGDNVWNRRSFKLKKKRVRNEPDMWIRAYGAFEAIVERELFEAARTIINARSFRLSDNEMLQSLKDLYRRKGVLSGIVIDECDGLPSSSAYSSRFGCLLRAYSLVGFNPDRDFRYVEINRELRKLHPQVLSEVLDGLCDSGSEARHDTQTDKVTVNGEFSLSVVIARCIQTSTGLLRWKIRFDTSLAPDITIVVRMDGANRAPFDYYLFPRIDLLSEKLRLCLPIPSRPEGRHEIRVASSSREPEPYATSSGSHPSARCGIAGWKSHPPRLPPLHQFSSLPVLPSSHPPAPSKFNGGDILRSSPPHKSSCSPRRFVTAWIFTLPSAANGTRTLSGPTASARRSGPANRCSAASRTGDALQPASTVTSKTSWPPSASPLPSSGGFSESAP